MPLSVIRTRASVGIEAPLVLVEVHISNGLPSFSIVGLPETSVKEARDRVRSALINCQFEFPAKKITVNLAPADLPKMGARYDLAIAIGIIAATSYPSHSLDGYEFVGELALSGEIRAVSGVLPSALAANTDKNTLIVPHLNHREAQLIPDAKVVSASHLTQVHQHVFHGQALPIYQEAAFEPDASSNEDMADIIGQEAAKRALTIAAAGGHNILFFGPPGTGKTMLARRLNSIMPELSQDEWLEVAMVKSISHKTEEAFKSHSRPFRNPHHSCSVAALVGGGSAPKPGEVTLAHKGILFLDELTEFPRHVLDALRAPIESGEVTISRAAQQTTFPASFQLVAALNPSPSGDIHDGRHSPDQILRYLNRISGPLLDRIDLQVDVPRLSVLELEKEPPRSSKTSTELRQKVKQARQLQASRGKNLNALLEASELKKICDLLPEDSHFLHQAIDRLKLSMRSMHRILKVSRTIADLENSEQIKRAHIAEALSYRTLERTISRLSQM